MNHISETDIITASTTLLSGGIAVLRTDTIYGVVARANDKEACERIYAVKGRDASKACIVLIANDAQIWDQASREAFVQASQGIGSEPTSIIVPSGTMTPEWIPHESNTVAFRIPNKPALVKLLLSTGPLIAPSANPAGDTPAETIEQAEAYFSDSVDLYVDGGSTKGVSASRVVRVTDSGPVERVR